MGVGGELWRGSRENGADGKVFVPILSPGHDLLLEERVEASPRSPVGCFVFMWN